MFDLQRLKFLGNSVLEYLITVHQYNKHPGISPGLLSQLRSATVNNDCLTQSAIRVRLHEPILHFWEELSRHITSSLDRSDKVLSGSTFGWELENYLPKVSVAYM